jgi:N-acylneuraminate cytidylyltransferase
LVTLKLLFVIPARGGSKGIPGKNIKPLAGKPLIHYSLEYARQFEDDENICVSTDAAVIAESVKGHWIQGSFYTAEKFGY